MNILTKHIPCECKCKFGGRRCNSNQNWNNHKCWCECKNKKEHNACEKDYILNHVEYLDCTIENLVVTCVEIKDGC